MNIQAARLADINKQINRDRVIIFVHIELFDIVKHDVQVGDGFHSYEHASGGVFRFGSHMNAYSISFGYVSYLRHELLELGRPCAFEGVSSGRDHEVGIFKGRIGELIFSEGKGDDSTNGISLCLGSM